MNWKKKWFMEGIPNLQNVYSWMLNVNFIYVEIHLKIISLFNHLWASSLPWAELDPWLLCLCYSHSLPLKNNSSSYIFPFPHFKANKVLWPSWLRNGLCFWVKSQFPARCTPSGFLKSLNWVSMQGMLEVNNTIERIGLLRSYKKEDGRISGIWA